MVPEMSVFGAATGVWARELTDVENAVVAVMARMAKIEINLLRMVVSSFERIAVFAGCTHAPE
jgi:hypothetical protein